MAAQRHKSFLQILRPTIAATGSEAERPAKTIEDASTALQATAASVLDSIFRGPELSTDISASSFESPAAAGSAWAEVPREGQWGLDDQAGPGDSSWGSQLEVHVAQQGQGPGPGTERGSYVYVVRRADGWFYCGQTDNISGAAALTEDSDGCFSQLSADYMKGEESKAYCLRPSATLVYSHCCCQHCHFSTAKESVVVEIGL